MIRNTIYFKKSVFAEWQKYASYVFDDYSAYSDYVVNRIAGLLKEKNYKVKIEREEIQ